MLVTPGKRRRKRWLLDRSQWLRYHPSVNDLQSTPEPAAPVRVSLRRQLVGRTLQLVGLSCFVGVAYSELARGGRDLASPRGVVNVLLLAAFLYLFYALIPRLARSMEAPTSRIKVVPDWPRRRPPDSR